MEPGLNSNPNPNPVVRGSLRSCISSCVAFLVIISFFTVLIIVTIRKHHEIELLTMDFTATVNSNSTSHYGRDSLRSTRWDLLIHAPSTNVNHDMCVEGNIQASFLYNNVTLVTSPIQRYNRFSWYKLMVSASASEEDLNGVIGKTIIEAIKERNEVWFGSRLSITDCKEDRKKGPMNFVCKETALRFEPSGSDQIKATSLDNDLTCIIDR